MSLDTSPVIFQNEDVTQDSRGNVPDFPLSELSDRGVKCSRSAKQWLVYLLCAASCPKIVFGTSTAFSYRAISVLFLVDKGLFMVCSLGNGISNHAFAAFGTREWPAIQDVLKLEGTMGVFPPKRIGCIGERSGLLSQVFVEVRKAGLLVPGSPSECYHEPPDIMVIVIGN